MNLIIISICIGYENLPFSDIHTLQISSYGELTNNPFHVIIVHLFICYAILSCCMIFGTAVLLLLSILSAPASLLYWSPYLLVGALAIIHTNRCSHRY